MLKNGANIFYDGGELISAGGVRAFTARKMARMQKFGDQREMEVRGALIHIGLGIMSNSDADPRRVSLARAESPNWCNFAYFLNRRTSPGGRIRGFTERIMCKSI